jgi:KipI family sensor histidine kinase inhibitor
VKQGKGRSRVRPSSGEACDALDLNVRYLSCGDTAFAVEFANKVSPGINGRVIALHAAIGRAQAAGQLAGLVETVPTMRSLMVTYDPLLTSRATLQPAIERMIECGLAAEGSSRDVTIPCCYDDPDFAPDLKEVAERTGKSPEQVIAGHLASAFKVYHLGFMPGLAYIVGLDPSLVLPRRDEPRVRVPRSSVAIAMDWTTIYPFESPAAGISSAGHHFGCSISAVSNRCCWHPATGFLFSASTAPRSTT